MAEVVWIATYMVSTNEGEAELQKTLLNKELIMGSLSVYMQEWDSGCQSLLLLISILFGYAKLFFESSIFHGFLNL